MVLEKLGESLKSTLQKLARAVFVDDALINEVVRELQRALLQADVNVKLVFELSQRVKDRAIKEPQGALTKKEQMINILYEELTGLLGGEKKELLLAKGKPPAKIMLVGLFGSGKTTTAGKLARYYAKRGLKVALVGLDVHRPAAMDQLAQVAEQARVPAFVDKASKDPLAIYKAVAPKLGDYDLAIIDTAGRDALSKELIEELKAVRSLVEPDETLLVIPADIGQAAMAQAKAFHEAGQITGVIITRMDGTAKGGGALSACAATKAGVSFIGVGEKLEDLEPFNPKGFVGRLLGMGDIEALLEKAKEAVTEEETKDIEAKLLKGEMNLLELYQQMEAMAKMGPLGKILEMIPGLGQLHLPKEALQVQEAKLKKWKHAMASMTREELEEPEIINSSRVERISKGSGVPPSEIRELLKQYRLAKKMLKMLKPGIKSPEQLLSKLSKKSLFEKL